MDAVTGVTFVPVDRGCRRISEGGRRADHRIAGTDGGRSFEAEIGQARLQGGGAPSEGQHDEEK